jgi:hypothetical protein
VTRRCQQPNPPAHPLNEGPLPSPSLKLGLLGYPLNANRVVLNMPQPVRAVPPALPRRQGCICSHRSQVVEVANDALHKIEIHCTAKGISDMDAVLVRAMDPQVFYDEFAKPNYDDFKASPADRRKAFNACLNAASIFPASCNRRASITSAVRSSPSAQGDRH